MRATPIYHVEPNAQVAEALKAKYAISTYDRERVGRLVHLGRFSPAKFGIALKRLRAVNHVVGHTMPRELRRDEAVLYVLCAENADLSDTVHTLRGANFAVVLQELWYGRFREQLNTWADGGSGVDYISAKLAEEVGLVHRLE